MLTCIFVIKSTFPENILEKMCVCTEMNTRRSVVRRWEINLQIFILSEYKISCAAHVTPHHPQVPAPSPYTSFVIQEGSQVFSCQKLCIMSLEGTTKLIAFEKGFHFFYLISMRVWISDRSWEGEGVVVIVWECSVLL